MSWFLLCAAGTAWSVDIEEVLPPGVSSEEASPAPSAPSPRPISKIAENVTVITSEQIKLLNAHSLADILRTVPGIDIQTNRTPGSFTFFSIQGEEDGNSTILLFMDGINQGALLQGFNDPGLIPVQNIDRVEIIKGAASTTWGAALGGVVNVVTKNPEESRPYSGTASLSSGEKKTGELSAELTGTRSGFGYYLSGGSLHSDGLLPNNGTTRNNLYAKLTYDLPAKGDLTFGIAYSEAKRGLLEVYAFDFDPPFTEHDNAVSRRYHSFLTLTYPLLPDLSLELTGHDSTFHDQALYGQLDEIGQVVPSNKWTLDERNSGGKLRLVWGDSLRNLVSGVEYLHSSITNQDRLHPEWGFFPNRRRDSLALYTNATYTLGQLTLLPGFRYDKTGLDENTTNVALGATYQVGAKTLLRSYWATGHAMPIAILKSVPARVRTFQAGIESEAIPYLWLKGTYFHNHIWHIQDYRDAEVFSHTRTLQGFELEARTAPFAGFSFRGGYTFIDARDETVDEHIKGLPVHLAKLIFSYANASRGTDLLLFGNYTWLNMEGWRRAHYSPIIWNLHLNQKLFPGNERSPELFFSINNVFNGAQYGDYFYKNTRRWIEGGMRFSF
jgi:vitamin B12 transporter